MALTNSESLSTDPLTTHRSPTQTHQTLISYLMTFYISHSCTTSSSIPWVTIYPWLHCVLLSSWRVLRKLHVTLYCNWGVAPCLCSQVTMWDNYFSWHILTQTFILNKYLIDTTYNTATSYVHRLGPPGCSQLFLTTPNIYFPIFYIFSVVLVMVLNIQSTVYTWFTAILYLLSVQMVCNDTSLMSIIIYHYHKLSLPSSRYYWIQDYELWEVGTIIQYNDNDGDWFWQWWWWRWRESVMVFEQRRRSLESCLSKILAATDKIMKPCLLSNTAIVIIVINNIIQHLCIVIDRHHDIIIRKEDEQRAATTNDVMKPCLPPSSSHQEPQQVPSNIGTNTFQWSVVMCQLRTENGDSVLKVDKTVPAGEETATVSLHNVRNSIEEAYDDRGWSSGEDIPPRSIWWGRVCRETIQTKCPDCQSAED